MDPILEKIRKAAWPRGAVSWSVTELIAWLNEVEPIADHRGKFDWLEIPPIASATAIQEAYHQVARTRHPDLFRTRIDVATMDRLVRMYARVTGAYADLKEPDKCAAYLRELRGPRAPTVPPPQHTQHTTMRMGRISAAMAPMRSEISTRTPGQTLPPPRSTPPTTPPPIAAPPPAAPPPVAARAANAPDRPIDPAHAMNARALSFYRRAEGVLKTGDRAAAMLHLKMAIAADPKSTFLRAALTELMRS